MQSVYAKLRISSFTGRIRLIAGAIVVTICLLTLLFLILFGKMIKGHEIHASLQETLDIQRLFIDKWKSERIDTVTLLAGLPSVRSMDPNQLGQLQRLLRESPLMDFDSISIVNKDGKILLGDQDTLQQDIVDRDYFTKVRSYPSAVSEVITGRISGKPLLAFSAPVRGMDGSFAGAVVGLVDMNTLDAIVNEFQFGDGGETYLLSKDGQRFTKGRGEADTERIRDFRETAIYRQAVAGELYTRPYLNGDGDKVYGAFSWTSDRQWLLVGETQTGNIYKPYYSLLAIMGTIIAIVMMAGYFAAMLFAKRVSLQLRNLLNGTKRIRAGEFGYKIDPEMIRASPAELRELSNNFNIMSDKLESTVKLLEKTAVIDHLTEVYNRRFLLNEGWKIEEAAARAGNASCILLIDLDNFKKINDTYGHLIGDRVLKHAAGLLVSAVRNSDVAARYGGEEFVVLATNCELGQGRELAERIRVMFTVSPYKDEGRVIALTVSIGVSQTCLKRSFGTNQLEDMIERADKALYRAKHLGRNRVECDDLGSDIRDACSN